MPIQPLDHVKSRLRRAVRRGECAGAVLLVGRRDERVVEMALGHRMLRPHRRPMRRGTIFDLASLTKAVATAPAVMALVEDGQCKFDDPVYRFLPVFGRGCARHITLEHLLTHTSGLPSYRNFSRFRRRDSVLKAIADLPLRSRPGERFVYSDLGFILLGEIVRVVAGVPLDEFFRQRIGSPLGMRHTCFNPPSDWATQCAATERRRGRMLCGEVHDENAYVLGEVAGHAGLFSTARDLERFARMVLGEAAPPLSPATIQLMTRPRELPDGNVRALGWDVDTAYSGPRGHLFPIGSFGHTGFTGTSMWLDPVSHSYVILLTNRLHPAGKGDVRTLRAEIGTLAALLVEQRRTPRRGAHSPVRLGIDVLQSMGFTPLKGRRVGLVTNASAVDRTGRPTLDILRHGGGYRLVAIFSPEHGLSAQEDEPVASGRDERSGLIVHSLYGKHLRPTPSMLRGIDCLVMDIQDVGARFYTYATTMTWCMEEAAKRGIEFVALDRPNPLTGLRVEGPILRLRKRALSTFHRTPVVHGLTLGELAQFANREYGIHCNLKVIPMENWRREMWFDDTGLPWRNPSPNLRNLRQTILYPAICCLERANVSVGRGTDTPFEWFGAPWVDSAALCEALNDAGMPGLSFVPVSFQPTESRFAGQTCHGVYIMLNDREAFRPVYAGVHFARALYAQTKHFALRLTGPLFGTHAVPRAIARGESPEKIARGWLSDETAFRRRCRAYWLYQ